VIGLATAGCKPGPEVGSDGCVYLAEYDWSGTAVATVARAFKAYGIVPCDEKFCDHGRLLGVAPQDVRRANALLRQLLAADPDLALLVFENRASAIECLAARALRKYDARVYTSRKRFCP
jgi:hypothetical protein